MEEEEEDFRPSSSNVVTSSASRRLRLVRSLAVRDARTHARTHTPDAQSSRVEVTPLRTDGGNKNGTEVRTLHVRGTKGKRTLCVSSFFFSFSPNKMENKASAFSWARLFFLGGGGSGEEKDAGGPGSFCSHQPFQRIMSVMFRSAGF